MVGLFLFPGHMRKENDFLFVMVDANAEPGPFDGRHVLSSGFQSNANTSLLQDFLVKHDLCLPATGVSHIGTNTTWRSPNGQHEHCIDHIAIPCEFAQQCSFSGVLQDFDLGNGLWDNCAVGAQLEWTVLCPAVQDVARGLRCAYAKDHITASQVKDVMDQFASPCWSTNI